MSQQPNANPPTSTLAVVALVAVFFCPPVALILAIIALVRISASNGALGGKTLAIVALCMNVAFVPMIGIMAAIAIPNFIKFQCRSKQSEAKGNLKALYIGEESFRAEQDTYSTDTTAIQFQPRGTKIRYEYVVVSADKQHFIAEARGVADDVIGDLWRITENNDLVNVTNRCGR